MTAPAEESGRLVEDVLPAPIEESAVPVELNRLLPWHRPRKQLVREEQWLRLSGNLITREIGGPGLARRGGGEPEVRYLTLPGIDYLDVRQLADVCGERGCCLTSVGFQSGGEGNREVARAQVREKALIDGGYITNRSYTLPTRFEDIVNTNGPAYRELRSRGPFHIVNIDACGSIAAPRAEHASRLVDALYRTVELQLAHMASRWLLLITTDARPETVAEETLARLCDAIFANAEVNEAFRHRAVPLLAGRNAHIREAVEAAAEAGGLAFLRLFGLGMAKWLLDLAVSKRWDMKTHQPYCYSTRPRGDDRPSMACLAFEFLPPLPALQDRLEVARARPAPNPEREDTCVRAAVMMEDMSNADAKMLSDGPLRMRVTRNLKQWLEEAGYEPGALEELGA